MEPSLRTFPLDGDLISTFEQDSSCDPTVVKLTTTNPKLYKYDVLFPELLSLPLRRNPVPSESRPPSTDPIRGFPIRWSSVELPWLAYLPVVVTYHYPIFASMNRSPDTEPDRGKFKLSQRAIDHWSNVESVMDSTIRKLQDMATVCWHHPPSYPASYGYRRPFKKRRDAKDIIKNSLLAFQHMLAYCSYMFASIETPRASRDQRTLYEDSSRIFALYRDTEDNGNRGGSHILLKHLWSSLEEVHRTRNFIGVVITHDQRYDYRSVEVMRSYGVPIYVRWSSHLRLESYRNFPQGDALASWRPSIDSFATLDLPQRSANFHPSVSSVQQPPSPLPPVALDQYADRYPWKYVEERKGHIESNPTKPESWLGRERSAKSFSPPGSRGARTYQFTSVGTIEESTGREIPKWERTMLSRAEAQTLWNGVDPRKLWYDCERNEWNHCYEFNFAENARARGWEPIEDDDDDDDDDDDEYMWGGDKHTREVEGSRGANEYVQRVDEPPQGDKGHGWEDPPESRGATGDYVWNFDALDSWGMVPLQPKTDAVSLHSEHPASHHEADVQMVDDPPPLQPEQTDTVLLHSEHSASHREVDVQMVDDPPPPQPEQTDAGSHNEHPMPVPFDSRAQLEQLRSEQRNTSSELVSVWNDAGEFLRKRYGLLKVSSDEAADKQRVWSAGLGLTLGAPSTSIVQLYTSFDEGAWPPSICDASPNVDPCDSLLTRSPSATLRISHVPDLGAYVVALGGPQEVNWRLLIRDPLTLLQIEREGWDRDQNSLVVNLIKKGVTFQILNPQKLEGAEFYDHLGPIVHPTGRAPEYVDYLAYRQELGDFFARYPHAYAAALSAGGILWRIAVDVLPLPDESDITRQFHPAGCISLLVNGVKYWTPKLTVQEEEVVVGIYKWAASIDHSPQDNGWWPKRLAWENSGLEFGAWAPLDENWYAKRTAILNTTEAECIRSSAWTTRIKYQKKNAKVFLTKARSLAASFIKNHRPEYFSSSQFPYN